MILWALLHLLFRGISVMSNFGLFLKSIIDCIVKHPIYFNISPLLPNNFINQHLSVDNVNLIHVPH